MYTPKQSIELFHLLFLKQLETKLDKKLYALKGGCNLRFFFKSIRYSEDIDLDVHTIARETLRHKIATILESVVFKKILQQQNMELVHCSEAKQSDTTQRWKLGIKLKTFSMVLPTKIEFSRRINVKDLNAQSGVVCFEMVDKTLTQKYRLYPILVNHYSATEAFYQKINALILRSQTQARDVFYLKLLLDHLGHKFYQTSPHGTQNFNVHQAIENLEAVTFMDFKSQVLSFLLEEYQAYYNHVKIWESLKQEIYEVIEALQP